MSKELPQLTPDYSYISRLRSCARRFFYEHERSLHSPEVFAPLKAGQAFHDGLEAWNLTDSVETGVEALRESWDDFTVRQERYDYLTEAHLVGVFRRFCEAHTDSPREIVKTGSEIFGERVFTIDWDGLSVGGKIDLVESTADGQLYVLDYKTTSGWVNSYWAAQKQFEINHQGRVYTAAVQEELDRPVSGFYIQAIYVGEHANEEDRDWENQQSSPWRLFGPYSWNSAELAETREWLAEGLAEIEWRRERESAFERAEFAWPQTVAYHCSHCDFRELCEANPVVRDGLIEHRYEKRELTGQLASGADSDD